ncbi:hypothetical protein SKAU_G00368400 [Synaphobranchus kaupii]|uniref:Uncharacterized protein n=1 Tax=Synaphobranchus kaupii TaxID=118154 RepID=A0A9Q1IFN2_SYNKA|nr:hypothetical protein SKAU_G00368400 [Synaphobranchus kaupii]
MGECQLVHFNAHPRPINPSKRWQRAVSSVSNSFLIDLLAVFSLLLPSNETAIAFGQRGAGTRGNGGGRVRGLRDRGAINPGDAHAEGALFSHAPRVPVIKSLLWPSRRQESCRCIWAQPDDPRVLLHGMQPATASGDLITARTHPPELPWDGRDVLAVPSTELRRQLQREANEALRLKPIKGFKVSFADSHVDVSS